MAQMRPTARLEKGDKLRRLIFNQRITVTSLTAFSW
jgi:hypothetical protein